jgi:hypothetical protein
MPRCDLTRAWNTSRYPFSRTSRPTSPTDHLTLPDAELISNGFAAVPIPTRVEPVEIDPVAQHVDPLGGDAQAPQDRYILDVLDQLSLGEGCCDPLQGVDGGATNERITGLRVRGRARC